MALAPGETFGRYTIVGTLGIGGMGQVLRAVDNVLERTVALKIIRSDRSERDDAVGRFFREARLSAQLTHPNTIQVYDLGEIDGVAFIAMEYIEGRPLSSFCEDSSIAAARKLRWVLDAARGLAAAHKRGMVHRDVKPANIMVSTDDVVKVVDFGLAKRAATTPELRHTFHTELGFLVGTPVFMAPEQLEGKEADARSDQFAWGLTAYALLTGANPRRRDPLLLSPITPVDECVSGVSAAVGAVIMRALRSAAEARYAAMDTLVAELEQALTQQGLPVVPAAAPAPSPSLFVVTKTAKRIVISPDDSAHRAPQTIETPPPPAMAAPPGVGEEEVTQAEPAPPGLAFELDVHPVAGFAPRRLDERIPLGEDVRVGLVARTLWPIAPTSTDATTWRFERHAEACPVAPVRVAAISPNGERVVVAGPRGMAVHADGAWRVVALPRTLDPAHVACAAMLPDYSVVVGGEAALAWRISADDTCERWTSDAEWADASLRGVEVTKEGWITFVGHRGTGGVFAWLRRDHLTFVRAGFALDSVATLTIPHFQIACGPRGAIVSTGLSVSGRRCVDANLKSVTAFGDEALVVGAGGYALLTSRWLATTLDPVETRGTLTVVTTSDAGTAWAASHHGRILRRNRAGKWMRVSGDLGAEPRLLALWASEDRVRAVADDGSLVLGWRTS